jgi:hypothetical protein
VPDRKDRPKLVHPGWPVKVKTGAMLDDPDAIFMVSVADREEKGSDVNVATHLLTDVCEQKIEAAVVVSNDSDLALPIKHARARVPVGRCTLGPTTPPVRSVAVLMRGWDDIGGDSWPSLTTWPISCPTLLVGTGVPRGGDDHALCWWRFDRGSLLQLSWMDTRPAPRGSGFFTS